MKELRRRKKKTHTQPDSFAAECIAVESLFSTDHIDVTNSIAKNNILRVCVCVSASNFVKNDGKSSCLCYKFTTLKEVMEKGAQEIADFLAAFSAAASSGLSRSEGFLLMLTYILTTSKDFTYHV